MPGNKVRNFFNWLGITLFVVFLLLPMVGITAVYLILTDYVVPNIAYRRVKEDKDD